ncbi:LANO_0G11386g1_1 [Lachancea nothofagi CBS 11611]|uniref:LANO_0G11386g1_1 n=1 Tax=Lachancea nothofagi CBS 11611 TaxID=1266666 RepID=A0A1G4KJG4_9SACH|nr:LANO_0G11386g1_1 [Lachancea nothofagi CBS 11611]
MPESTPVFVSKPQKKPFRYDLMNQLCFLGCAVIIIHYLKYGSSTIAFFFRLFVQSLLSKSQVVSQHLRRISLNSQSRASRSSPGANGNAASNGSNPPMPGTFTVRNAPTGLAPEAASEEAVNEAEKNVRWFLFHCSFTFNCISILMALIWPVNFCSKIGQYQLSKNGVGNTPSPFDNQNGLVGGELRRTFFVQFIGERVPTNNLRGNMNIVFLEVLILIFQFSLFILTAYNFTEPPIEDVAIDAENSGQSDSDTNSSKDDGFSGNVLVTTLNPIEVIDHLLQERFDQTSPSSNSNSLV